MFASLASLILNQARPQNRGDRADPCVWNKCLWLRKRPKRKPYLIPKQNLAPKICVTSQVNCKISRVIEPTLGQKFLGNSLAVLFVQEEEACSETLSIWFLCQLVCHMRTYLLYCLYRIILDICTVSQNMFVFKNWAFYDITYHIPVKL